MPILPRLKKKKKEKTEGITSEEEEESVESIFWISKKVFQEGKRSHLGKMMGFPSRFFPSPLCILSILLKIPFYICFDSPPPIFVAFPANI